MSEELVQRLRGAAAISTNGQLLSRETLLAAADRIEALERELATSRHMHSQAFSAGVGEKLRATTAESALASALQRLAETEQELETESVVVADLNGVTDRLLKRLAEVAEIASATARRGTPVDEIATEFAVALDRIATIASNNPNG